jgi:light-independent protochlorophyllide reductase subunit B
VLGTQMERHIAKRLGIPCAVISTPAHVQDYPARYSPQMGHEGANVIFDSWVHPLMMGLEEHLLAMFREDFEFHDNAAPSHLAAETGPATAGHGASGTSMARETATADIADGAAPANGPTWDISAERSCARFPSLCAARRGAIRNSTPANAASR